MKITILMLILYFMITIGISMVFTKQNRKSNVRKFSIAGGGLGIPLIAGMLFSELIAGAGTIGNAASGYRMGISSVWANWGMAMGCILFVILVSKFYRAMGIAKKVISVPEAFEHLFDYRCKMVLLVIVVVVYGILYSTQSVAAASIMAPLLNIDRSILSWVLTGIFVVIVITGGMKGVAWMNVIHAITIFFGMFFVSWKSVASVGGIRMLYSELPSGYFSFGQPDWPTTIASAIGTEVSFLAAATVVNATLSAKSRQSANVGIVGTALLVIPFALAPAITGMCAKVMLPDIDANTALFAMASSLGDVYGGIVGMAVMAAILSTAPALLLIVCTTLARDFYKGMLRKNANDSQELYFIRCATVIMGFGGNLFGLHADTILNQMLGAFQIRSIAGIVLTAAIFWTRVTSDAAFWSMLIGGITAAVWHFLNNPFGISPLWPAAAICLFILIVMSLMSDEKISPGHKKYQEALKELVKTM